MKQSTKTKLITNSIEGIFVMTYGILAVYWMGILPVMHTQPHFEQFVIGLGCFMLLSLFMVSRIGITFGKKISKQLFGENKDD